MTSLSKKLFGFLFTAYIAFNLVLVLFFTHYSVEDETDLILTYAPDFKAIEDVDARKQAFFDYFAPIIEQKNNTLLDQRDKLLSIVNRHQAGKKLNRRELARLESLREQYHVAEDLSFNEQLAELEKRINILPVSLALAQAAKESAWGTSRFARQGNNFFGEWCFTEGCGIVPKNRSAGANHEVRKFSFPAQSVFSYFRNINTHPAYEELRDLRSALAESGKPLTGLDLAAALSNYSERRERYVKEVKSIIVGNKLEANATELTQQQNK